LNQKEGRSVKQSETTAKDKTEKPSNTLSTRTVPNAEDIFDAASLRDQVGSGQLPQARGNCRNGQKSHGRDGKQGKLIDFLQRLHDNSPAIGTQPLHQDNEDEKINNVA